MAPFRHDEHEVPTGSMISSEALGE